MLSPPPQKLDHNLTGSGTDIGISPIIGDESCRAIIQPENIRPLHPQPSDFHGTNCNKYSCSFIQNGAMEAHRGVEANTLHILNPLNPELNSICYLLTLLGAHHFLHVSRIRVKFLTFRLLMSYIYGAPILDVSRSHTTTQHSR